MILQQTEAEKLFNTATRHTFYKHICDHCGETLIVDSSDCETVLFEPKEIEEEVTVMELDDDGKYLGSHKKIQKRLASSDRSKDIVRFKCPVCGELIEINKDDFFAKERVSLDGHKHRTFVLNEEETKKADEFIAKHNHHDEFMKEKRNPFFSTLGQQFSYTFIPGGLGNCVMIECNHCHETEDITDCSRW